MQFVENVCNCALCRELKQFVCNKWEFEAVWVSRLQWFCIVIPSVMPLELVELKEIPKQQLRQLDQLTQSCDSLFQGKRNWPTGYLQVVSESWALCQ